MNSVLGVLKPPKVNNDAQIKQSQLLDKQEKQQADERKTLQMKTNASLSANRKRRTGYRTLLTGMETGTNGVAQTRATLG